MVPEEIKPVLQKAGERQSWRARQPMLLGQLRWIVKLRWAAGTGVVAGGIAEHFWLHWYSGPGWWIMSTGLLILAYNAVFRILLRRPRNGERTWSRMVLYSL